MWLDSKLENNMNFLPIHQFLDTIVVNKFIKCVKVDNLVVFEFF